MIFLFLVDEKGNAMKIATETTKILNKIFNKKIVQVC
jgi:hypothetical protein